MLERVFHALVGLLFGLVAGILVTLGIVVSRARLEGVYLHDMAELFGWVGLPIVVLPVVGAWLGASEGRRLAPAAGGGVIGLAVGAAVGALAGGLLSSDPAWPWAGGIILAATGLLAGFLGSAIRSIRSRTTAAAAILALSLAGAASAGCGEPPPPLPEADDQSPPPAEAVDAVVYLVGDPGQARVDTHPILTAVRRDVEAWSERLGGEGRVAMVVLGDIIYPDGMSDPGSARWSRDSARVADQVWTVAGPAARRHGALGLFVAGNHDWGHQADWDGAVRLHRLARFLGRWRERGVEVSLEPAPGTGGPSVVDVGDHLRLVLLDTAWWLYDATPLEKDATVRGVADALATAGDRRTVVAAHHPFRSGGPHGDLLAIGSTLGLRTLLSRSGAILQDLHSEPYRDLRRRLEEVFREHGPPDVFAGGHEHSLQVVGRIAPAQPTVSLVSGSASKLTDVEPISGTMAAFRAPGYARLFVLEDGGLHLSVEAAPEAFLACEGGVAGPDDGGTGPGAADGCIERALRAYRTIWSGEVPRG